MLMNHILPLLAAMALAGPLAIAADDAYLVPVDRPVKVGQVQNLLLEGESTFRTEIQVNGGELSAENESWTAVLEGKLEVLEVAPDGDASALNLTVKKFSLTYDGKTTEPVKPGGVIKGKRIGDVTEFSIDGGQTGEKLTSVLKVMLPLSNPEDKTLRDENKGFGLDKPRKAGEHWEVDGKDLAATMPPDMPFSFNPEKTKGKMRLVEIIEKDGVKAALIQGEIELKVTGMKELPPGFKTNKGSMTMAVDGLFPLDATKPSLREGTSMNFDFTGGMPNAGMSLKSSGRFLHKQKSLP